MSGTATAIPTIHVSSTCMPACGHSTVPCFNSNALNLHLYFDKVEAPSTDTSSNDEGKIWHTLCYEDNKLWTMLPKAQLPDYTKFQDAIVKPYPRVDNERKYVESDLQRLIDMQKQYSIESRAGLGHYYCHISKFILDRQCLSDIEWNKRYMRGFDKRL
jgi:hypothetical protein